MAATHKGEEPVAVDLGDLLDAEDGAMVTLVAGDTRLAAHRAVLTDRSPVFAAMFRHDTLEASSGQVSIPDVEGPVLRQLLAFMYSLRAPQLPSMAPQLLAVADKYGLYGLKAACEEQVAAQLSVETAAATAALAVRHSCVSLRNTAIAFIKGHLVQVMATQGWADAIRAQPEDAVEVSRLLATEPPAETSVPAAADSATAPGPASAATPVPGTRPHSDLGRLSGAAASPTVARHTPPPDDTSFSQMRSLSGDDKARRLIQAAQEGALEELQMLLVAGADLEAGDGTGWTALHHAAAKGHLEAVRILVDSGADVAARNRWHATPLHVAAMKGRAAVVRLLTASDADPDATDEGGRTPLHWAARNGHAQAADALLEAGADKGATDNAGRTPLDIAGRRNDPWLESILI